MSDDWLRAETLWFGVDVVPEQGILPETKNRRYMRSRNLGLSHVTDETYDPSDDAKGEQRRRSVTRDRRLQALERHKNRTDRREDDEQ